MSGQTTTQSAYFPLPGGATLYETGATGGTRYFWHKDWLGSVRLSSTIQNRTVFFDRAFAPYGEMYNNFGNAGGLNFTGDTQDSFTGLFDTPNRELHPGQGRWLSPDSAGAGWNLYGYSVDPNSNIDPTGLYTLSYSSGSLHNCAYSGGATGCGSLDGGWDEFDLVAIANRPLTDEDGNATPIFPLQGLTWVPSSTFYDPASDSFYGVPGYFTWESIDWNHPFYYYPNNPLDLGAYYNKYYRSLRDQANRNWTQADFYKAMSNTAQKFPDLCNPGVSASAKVAGYGPAVDVNQNGVHGDFSLGLGKHGEVGTADPTITLSAGEGLGGSVTLNAAHPTIPTLGVFAGVETSNKLLEVDVSVHADVVGMGSCPP
jgi:RHS repeat-associated protein